MGSAVEDGLRLTNYVLQQAGKDGITVIETREDKGMYECFCRTQQQIAVPNSQSSDNTREVGLVQYVE